MDEVDVPLSIRALLGPVLGLKVGVPELELEVVRSGEELRLESGG